MSKNLLLARIKWYWRILSIIHRSRKKSNSKWAHYQDNHKTFKKTNTYIQILSFFSWSLAISKQRKTEFNKSILHSLNILPQILLTVNLKTLKVKIFKSILRLNKKINQASILLLTISHRPKLIQWKLLRKSLQL